MQNVQAGTLGVPAGQVIVTWDTNPASDDVDHYNVYRADGDCTGAFSDPPIASVAAGGATFHIDTPPDAPGPDTFCYAVTAVNGSGEEGPLDDPASFDSVTVGP